MPKVICKCGCVIQDIEIPNPHGNILISEVDLDTIESKSENLDLAFDAISDRGQLVYKCPQCSRLIIFPEGKSGPVYTYLLEKD